MFILCCHSDQMGNKGAFITLTKDLKPQFTTYEAVVSLVSVSLVWVHGWMPLLCNHFHTHTYTLHTPSSSSSPSPHPSPPPLSPFPLSPPPLPHLSPPHTSSFPLPPSHTSPTQTSNQCSMPVLYLACYHEIHLNISRLLIY